METTNIYEKKGQQGTVGAVVGLIVGVGVAVLVLIFVGVLGGNAYNIAESDINEIGNTAITGDTITATTGQAVNIGVYDIHSNTLVAYNTTAPLTALDSSNYTIDLSAGTFTLLENSFNQSTIGLNYSYGNIAIQTHVKSAVTSGFEALEDTGDYLPLIVLGIVIFLVLGLVLGMSMIKGGNSNNAL